MVSHFALSLVLMENPGHAMPEGFDFFSLYDSAEELASTLPLEEGFWEEDTDQRPAKRQKLANDGGIDSATLLALNSNPVLTPFNPDVFFTPENTENGGQQRPSLYAEPFIPSASQVPQPPSPYFPPPNSHAAPFQFNPPIQGMDNSSNRTNNSMAYALPSVSEATQVPLDLNAGQQSTRTPRLRNFIELTEADLNTYLDYKKVNKKRLEIAEIMNIKVSDTDMLAGVALHLEVLNKLKKIEKDKLVKMPPDYLRKHIGRSTTKVNGKYSFVSKKTIGHYCHLVGLQFKGMKVKRKELANDLQYPIPPVQDEMDPTSSLAEHASEETQEPTDLNITQQSTGATTLKKFNELREDDLNTYQDYKKVNKTRLEIAELMGIELGAAKNLASIVLYLEDLNTLKKIPKDEIAKLSAEDLRKRIGKSTIKGEDPLVNKKTINNYCRLVGLKFKGINQVMTDEQKAKIVERAKEYHATGWKLKENPHRLIAAEINKMFNVDFDFKKIRNYLESQNLKFDVIGQTPQGVKKSKKTE